MLAICSAVALGAFVAPSAMAQSNPFVPPQSAGMSKAQIEELVRQTVASSAKQQPARSNSDGSAGVTSQMKDGVRGLPTQQGGVPNANVASNMPQGPAAADPVADLLKDGGSFIGCVGGTPIFKDKIGRRAYFTTKELRESNEARRFTRCG